MNYLGLGVVGRAGARLYSSCKDLYNDLNGANLTGAVDIVVVKQIDGSYKATPFHVRFGKFGVLRTGDLQKEVEVEVNGESVSNRMMLDESGMAFFVKPKHSISSDPSTDSIFESRSDSFDSVSDPIYKLPEMDDNVSQVESLTTDHVSLETTTHTSTDSSHTTLTGVDLVTVDTEHTVEGTSETAGVSNLRGIAVLNEDDVPSGCVIDDCVSTSDDTTITITTVTIDHDTSELIVDCVNKPADSDSVPNGVTSDSVLEGITGDNVPVGVTSDTVTSDDVTSDSVPNETSDSVPNVTVDGVISDSVPNVTDDGVPNVTSDSVPNVTVDGVPNVTSDSVPNVTGDGITSDSVPSDGVTSHCVPSDDVTSDNVVTDGIVPCDGDHDHTVTSNHYHMHIDISDDLDKQQPVNFTSHDKSFYTPTDDPKQLQWLVNSDNNDIVVAHHDLTSDLDSGVLSDSALDLRTSTQKYHRVNEVHSDSELDGRNDKSNGEATPFTVTGVNAAERQPVSSNNMSPTYSLWGALTGIWSRRKRCRFSNIEDGIYLDELDNGRIGDKERAEYLPPPSPPLKASTSTNMEYPSDTSSGVDTSSQQSSPIRGFKSDQHNVEDIVAMLSDVSISTCGWDDPITEESFSRSQISFDEFCSNINLLSSSNTVIRMGDKYYNWLVAGPMIMSALLYQQQLPVSCREDLEQNHMFKNKPRQSSKKSRWSLWSREAAAEAKFGKPDQLQDSITTILEAPPTSATPTFTTDTPNTTNTTQSRPVLTMTQSLPSTRLITEDQLSSDEEVENEHSLPRVRQRSLRRKRLVFTNELTSEELSSWPLKAGKNQLVFSITTKYQGTAKASCSLYLWNHDEKIVVSDFDGTITRSDVAGQVLPFLGKDWTQFGVIELFSAIHDNGYRLLYLSARAIGQSMYTKNYLRNTRSRNYSLPDGPLLVTPFSLYKAFKKEVIERKPEEFKILCLQQIRAFFPDNYNPFHAGFGNKPSDAKSYLEVEIPSSRIFTVNPKGEIKNELTWTFQSSYIGLMGLVDAQFPHISKSDKNRTSASVSEDVNGSDTAVTSSSPMVNENFSSFMYWQQPLNSFGSFDLPDL